jgi:hypothetical protein
MRYSRFLRPLALLSAPGLLAACETTTEPPPVASLAIVPSALTLPFGFTQQFTTVQRDGAGEILPPRPVVWVSPNQAVVELSGDGLAVAVAPGAVPIQAYAGGLHATAPVTVPRLVFAVIAPGTGITCGVTDAQLAYCWGEDDGGQLGIGTLSAGSYQPVPIVGQQSRCRGART